MLARLSAFVIWALVAATAVFWALRLWTRPAEAPQYTVPVGDIMVARGDLSRLLGATPAVAANVVATPEAASRFRLIGIMAPKAAAAAARPGQGVALIAVDGKPPRAFVVGSVLDTNLVLQSVSMRSAALGPAQGAASLTLELPPLAAAATGTLPAFGAGAPRNPAAPAALPVPAVPVPVPFVPPPPVGQVRPGLAPTGAPISAGMPSGGLPAGGMPTGAMPVPPAGSASIPRDPNPPTATQ